MSWLEFIERMSSAWSWPIIALIAIIFLGSEIKSAAKSLVERVGDIAHLKAPGVAIDFKEVERLAETTEDLRFGIPTVTNEPVRQEVLLPPQTPDQRFERYQLLAKIDPRAAILLPFADLEATIRQEFQRRYPHERKGTAFIRILDTYARDGLIDNSLHNTLRELSSIRNRVAHEDFTVDTETAELYVQSIEDVSTYVLLMPLFGEDTRGQPD